jgi:hypothetical protein
MRKLVAEDGKKQSAGRNKPERPCGYWQKRREANLYKLDRRMLQVRRYHPDAEHEDNEPPSIYPHRDPVNTGHLKLPVD